MKRFMRDSRGRWIARRIQRLASTGPRRLSGREAAGLATKSKRVK